MKLVTTMAGALIAVPATLLSATGASAAPAQHDVLIEEYDAYEHFAGEDNPCGDWPGTLHEVRSGAYKVVLTQAGDDSMIGHVNGEIDGLFELLPDDPTLPTYSGDYREKLNVLALSSTEEGVRVVQYRLRTVLEGSDGSALTLLLAGKVTVNGRGDVVVERDEFSCG